MAKRKTKKSKVNSESNDSEGKASSESKASEGIKKSEVEKDIGGDREKDDEKIGKIELEKNSKKDDEKIEDKRLSDNKIDKKKSLEKNGDKKIEMGKEIEKNHNKQLKWAVILMISVLAIILIFYGWRYMESEYTYMNLDFQKTQLGDIIFHSTRIPIVDGDNQITGSYSINFRNDPRKLEDILIPASPPAFIADKTVYLTIDPEMEACEFNSVAIITLSSFLRDFGNLKIEAAISDEEYAENNGFPYVTCDSHLDYTVISLTNGDETKIQKTGAHCYELTYTNCEIMEVSEKFIIEIIREYMSYFRKV